MQTTAAASLTDHFHRFLEAVKEAFGLEGRYGLLAGPMALLFWLRTRRMRKEAAAAMAEAFRALMEQFASAAGGLPGGEVDRTGDAGGERGGAGGGGEAARCLAAGTGNFTSGLEC
jgi:hypothetical protein